MKEETQEASEKYVKNFAESVKSARQIGFMDGAKWQAERSYSEEEVLDLLYKRDLYLLNRDGEVELELPDEWFEQFKKK